LISVGTVRLVLLNCSLMKPSFHAVDKLKLIKGGGYMEAGKGKEAVIFPAIH